MKIERDQSRFKQIVRGKIRENLRKYVTHGEMIGRKGRDLVSIPVPAARRAALPLWQEWLGRRRARAKARTARRSAPAAMPSGGTGQAGSEPGAHILEVEVSLEELAAILGDELRAAPHRAQGQGQHRAGEGPLHQHPPQRARIAAALQAHLHGGAAAADRVEHLRARAAAHRADPRGQAVSLLERQSTSPRPTPSSST